MLHLMTEFLLGNFVIQASKTVFCDEIPKVDFDGVAVLIYVTGQLCRK